MMDFYGNENVVNTLTSMLDGERVFHAFLLYGDGGVGKKTLASQLALRLVGAASTRLATAHPDIFWAQHEGKSENFTVESLRKMRVDAFTRPNDSEKKVYILADCDGISAAAQDVLLKIIEEPPSFVHFILTATDKSIFLPTILSRVISLGLAECSVADCRLALTKKGCSTGEIERAMDCFGGNIGQCEAYISGSELKRSVEVVHEITDSIISRSEYRLLKSLCALESEKRPLVCEVLMLLGQVLRDCAVLQLGGAAVGCYKEGAQRLGLSKRRLGEVYDAVQDAILQLQGNVNMNAELTALCGRMI